MGDVILTEARCRRCGAVPGMGLRFADERPCGHGLRVREATCQCRTRDGRPLVRRIYTRADGRRLPITAPGGGRIA